MPLPSPVRCEQDCVHLAWFLSLTISLWCGIPEDLHCLFFFFLWKSKSEASVYSAGFTE